MTPLNRSLIAGLPAFQGLADGELDEIVNLARAARYPQDAVVFEQENEAHSFFLLLHGHIRVVRTTPNGAKLIVRYIGVGELFGIAAALGRSTYPASAVAAADCVALVWPNSAWPYLSSKFPAFRTGTYQTVARRLEETHTRVAEISTERAEQRIANALIGLGNQSGRKTAQGVEIDFSISRADIAAMTGTTLHTVSRLLSRWEAQGWVAGGRQRVVIKDRRALSKIADGFSQD